MKDDKKISSLSKISLKRRLCVAFTFATFAPIALIFYYIINSYRISVLAIYVLISVILVGWWFVFEVFSSVIKIYNKTQETLRHIKDHDTLGNIGIKNEVERLDVVFNMLSSKVKESVEELKIVSSKTEELSRAIAQKVKVFSSILEANSLFSKGAPSEDILQFLTERLRGIIQVNIVVIFFVREIEGKYYNFFSGINEDKVLNLLTNENINKLKSVITTRIIDKNNRDDKFLFVDEILGTKNFIIQPIYLRDNIVGFIIVGNYLDDFAFSDDDSEVINLFSYNMSILWERKNLYKKVEDLEIFDPLTGIYNEKFFLNRLEEEIKRATTYQRPCGLLVVEIVNYNEYKQKMALLELEKLLKKLVGIFKNNIRPIDILGRLREDRFGVILIERNRRQSQHMGTRLKEIIYNFLEENIALAPQIKLAVAENPIDGTNSQQLLECIHTQLKK